MRRILLVLIVLAASVAATSSQAAPDYSKASTRSALADQSLSRYGGHPGLTFPATGFFSTGREPNGRWWLVDPEGNAFYAVGISQVSSAGQVSSTGANPYADTVAARYGANTAAWVRDTADRLKAWGFNTIGPHSNSFGSMFPHTLDIGVIQGLHDKMGSGRTNDAYPLLWEDATNTGGYDYDKDYRRYFYDVFHPTFATMVPTVVGDRIASLGSANDPWLIGYLVDNELPFWYGRSSATGSPWATGNTLADVYIALPRTAWGKRQWVKQLTQTYGSVAALNLAWGTSHASFDAMLDATAIRTGSNVSIRRDKEQFLTDILNKYFSTVRNAVRAADPNHLYLCARLIVRNVSNPPQLFQSAAQNCDVVSLNYYIFDDLSRQDMANETASVYGQAYQGKPLLITEYSFAGQDSGMPATHLNGALVATQEKRAELTISYRGSSVSSPNMVGDLWWDYWDPPLPKSSWGNEDSNLGLVTADDKPYLRMLALTSKDNLDVYRRRGLGFLMGSVFNSFRSVIPLSPRSVGLGNRSIDSVDPLSRHWFAPRVAATRSGSGYAFAFTLAAPATGARLEIYDGRLDSASSTLKRTIALDALGSGRQEIAWDGTDSSGVVLRAGNYFYVLKVTTGEATDYAFDGFTLP